ncbi:hypothetical protein N7499_002891 [Penicillium canescens]|uniref:Uncharacterized protein n=1 Tax=Penicillium canescens TaxID=5083 RepID=A0AAD6N1H9_PENCN|nr:uncharacterized protein N7446_014144 [Penicillium canescens]KAJ6022344.1 hypothetical protein N7460_014088 [Penicillium canescens]KAJ6038992.1 hypothetical protein N7446_014144 [Penicillium canescens]KAJ6066232.1 hypothetical protein N7444_000224 [Penicillium canescens]KAJ6094295.1 hypothetical protein N7499_002891 [Penicillium canescens]KAJ6174667.1 hypothetical protein N7485_005404 [Penicillium canescens]
MVLTSNEKRAFFRQQCREALAAHINDRLGLVVAPSQVRLQPSAGDGYAWSVTESKKSLLQSNLGGGSVGLYRSICEELGWSLEAVTPQTLQVAQLERDHLPREDSGPARADEEESGSFTAKIRELECANHRMKNELGRISIHLQESLDENRTLHAKIRRLQDELDSSSSRATHLEDELVRVTKGITEAMQVLQDHQAQERSMPNLHGCRQGESGNSTDSMALGISQAPLRDEVA